MKNLRLSHTIFLLLGCSLVAGGAASAYLMMRCFAVSAAYETILQNEVAAAGEVRVVQVTFKKQVEAWKDILIRGKDDAALSKYEAEFHSLAGQVQNSGTDL